MPIGNNHGQISAKIFLFCHTHRITKDVTKEGFYPVSFPCGFVWREKNYRYSSTHEIGSSQSIVGKFIILCWDNDSSSIGIQLTGKGSQSDYFFSHNIRVTQHSARLISYMKSTQFYMLIWLGMSQNVSTMDAHLIHCLHCDFWVVYLHLPLQIVINVCQESRGTVTCSYWRYQHPCQTLMCQFCWPGWTSTHLWR